MQSWVQCTNLALDATNFDGKTEFWVTSLCDGSPVAKASIKWPFGSGETDSTGVLAVSTPGERHNARECQAIASLGADSVFLPYCRPSTSNHAKMLLHHTFTDRNLYKPNETVGIGSSFLLTFN